jgi:hypothetical protein
MEWLHGTQSTCTLYALLFSTVLAATAAEHVSVVHRGMLELLCWSSALGSVVSLEKSQPRYLAPMRNILVSFLRRVWLVMHYWRLGYLWFLV